LHNYPIGRLHVVTNSLTNTGGLSPIGEPIPCIFPLQSGLDPVLAGRVGPQSRSARLCRVIIAP
jgi:hypothetical protein